MRRWLLDLELAFAELVQRQQKVQYTSHKQNRESAEKYGGKESYQNLAVHFKLLGRVVVTYQFAEFSRSALDILKR